jgi:hypothetical protein
MGDLHHESFLNWLVRLTQPRRSAKIFAGVKFLTRRSTYARRSRNRNPPRNQIGKARHASKIGVPHFCHSALHRICRQRRLGRKLRPNRSVQHHQWKPERRLVLWLFAHFLQQWVWRTNFDHTLHKHLHQLPRRIGRFGLVLAHKPQPNPSRSLIGWWPALARRK